MKNTVWAAVVAPMLLLTTVSSAAAADDDPFDFYVHKDHDKKLDLYWAVYGTVHSDPKLDASCYLEQDYQDGGAIKVTKDLETGAFNLVIRLVDWNLKKGKDDEKQLQLNFMKGDRLVKGGQTSWMIHDKDTIAIPLDMEPLYWAMTRSDNVRVIMPGDTINTRFKVPGRQSMDAMVECILKYKDAANAVVLGHKNEGK